MSDPVIQEIKSRIDIVPFIQGYVKLSRAGINWKGLCPFHSEKSPSFMVSPTRATWHCFGCSKGGDIFKFLMELDHVEFRDALKQLAERAGVELVKEDPRLRSERERQYNVVETATKFYEAHLARNPAVMDYLKRRGLKEETIKEFRIGYAPDSWDALDVFLMNKGFSGKEFVESGLGIKSDRRENSYYDRFRNRVMFPITDSAGRVVGFSGRIFERGKKTDEPKYVNSPQTLIYDKSRILYPFDKAKEAIRKKNRCVIVEGQMDVIMSHQAGIREAVAVSGTALTEKHLEILKRLTDTLISSFDTDAAGETATRRSLDMAAEFDFNRKVAVIREGKDPAEAILENPKLWEEAVDQSVSIMDFYFSRAQARFNVKSPEAKKEFSRYLLPEVVKIANEIERAHWVGKIAQTLGLREEAVWMELARYQQRGVDGRADNTVESPKSPEKLKIQKLEERVLGAFFLLPYARTLLKAEDLPFVFTKDFHQTLFGIIQASEPDLETSLILAQVPEEWRQYADQVIFEAELLFQNVKNAEAEVLSSLKELKRERLRERLTQLAESIADAERESDEVARAQLLADFKSVAVSLAHIDRP